jgi:hypothetical protein
VLLQAAVVLMSGVTFMNTRSSDLAVS